MVEESKQLARDAMESLGYSVTDIAESSVPGEKRADLSCSHGSEVLIVEAKGKSAHEAFVQMLAESHTGPVITRKVTPWNALSSFLEKGARQLAATPPLNATHILFVACTHSDAKFVFETLHMCLYGQVDLILWRKTDTFPERVGDKPCLYYERAAFRRFSNIDAVVFFDPRRGSCLLVNEFGENGEALRKSLLYESHRKGKAIIEPEELRDSGEAFAILDDIHPDERHGYLLRKYGFLTQTITWTQMDGRLSIPRSAFEEEAP